MLEKCTVKKSEFHGIFPPHTKDEILQEIIEIAYTWSLHPCPPGNVVLFFNVSLALAPVTSWRVFPFGNQMGLILNGDGKTKAGPNPERGVKVQENSFSLFNSTKTSFLLP